jgi:tetraacyldisaccharide 4'-kinase
MMLRPQEVEASWYGRSHLGALQHGLLLVLSHIYGAGVTLRRCCYEWGLCKQIRLPVPVLVVGNLIVGGAGKTPVALALAQQLKELGWHPGIISRGYGRKVPGVRAVGVGDSPQHVGDEPLLYAQHGFPVFVGEKRAAAGRALLAANPSVNLLIADDGLQHLNLARDIEIVVFDQRGVGNGHLLPLGPLRESFTRLSDPLVHGIVVQGHPDQSGWPELPRFKMTLMPDSVYALNQPARKLSLEDFAGQSVLAVAGIGHPERFFTMLRESGLKVEGLSFADHHDFTATDIPPVRIPVLMTEKDAVKCQHFAAGHDNWFVVPVSARFTPVLPLAKWLSDNNAEATLESR